MATDSVDKSQLLKREKYIEHVHLKRLGYFYTKKQSENVFYYRQKLNKLLFFLEARSSLLSRGHSDDASLTDNPLHSVLREKKTL